MFRYQVSALEHGEVKVCLNYKPDSMDLALKEFYDKLSLGFDVELHEQIVQKVHGKTSVITEYCVLREYHKKEDK